MKKLNMQKEWKKERITSILKTDCLDSSVTGLETFDLSDLNGLSDPDFVLPSNVRLGHLAEKVVSGLIKSSDNYRLIAENIQVIEDKKTIGELDFIIKDLEKNRVLHVELAYKFYLYDPSISSIQTNNWIGPNRRDSLIEKLEKLKSKQFPLLYHSDVQKSLSEKDVFDVSQALCFLASLFVPYGNMEDLSPACQKAVKGHYLSFETFARLDQSTNSYYLPRKTEWGIAPSENESWSSYSEVEEEILKSLEEKRAPLCWQKQGESYSQFFIVWW